MTFAISRNSVFLFTAQVTCALMLTSAQADGDHAPIGEAVKDLPIFDAHVHYKQPAWDRIRSKASSS